LAVLGLATLAKKDQEFGRRVALCMKDGPSRIEDHSVSFQSLSLCLCKVVVDCATMKEYAVTGGHEESGVVRRDLVKPV
jgi:hypothetical protein